ncbi:MAG: hypothetical protein QOD10_5132 [Mycobacterium sp.]|jgi:hypothetical protein|nr:hypothetical protein [Mycobacterium sp.]
MKHDGAPRVRELVRTETTDLTLAPVKPGFDYLKESKK